MPIGSEASRPPTAPAERSAAHALLQLWEVAMHPGRTLPAALDTPRPWPGLLAYASAMLLIAITAVPHAVALSQHLVKQLPHAQQTPSTLHTAAFFTAFGVLAGAPLSVLLSVSVVAAILGLFVYVLPGKLPTFTQRLQLTVCAGAVPHVLGALVDTVVILTQPPALMHQITVTPAAWLPAAARAAFAGRALSRVSPFSLWTLWIIAEGLAALHGATRARTRAWVFGGWVAYVLLAALPPTLPALHLGG